VTRASRFLIGLVTRAKYATAASLLGLLDLSGGELTGAELVRVAQQRIGDFWSLTRSQVCRELARSEAEGHVEPGPRGVRESRPYRITASGREIYRTWLTERLPGDTVRVPLLLAVAFGSVLPERQVAALLRRSAEEHRNRLDSYRALAADLDELGLDVCKSTLSFGVHYEEAVLRWFDALPDEVTHLVDADEVADRESGASKKNSAAGSQRARQSAGLDPSRVSGPTVPYATVVRG
jgi:DNA-binding PadR family transcriptional regulator